MQLWNDTISQFSGINVATGLFSHPKHDFTASNAPWLVRATDLHLFTSTVREFGKCDVHDGWNEPRLNLQAMLSTGKEIKRVHVHLEGAHVEYGQRPDQQYPLMWGHTALRLLPMDTPCDVGRVARYLQRDMEVHVTGLSLTVQARDWQFTHEDTVPSVIWTANIKTAKKWLTLFPSSRQDTAPRKIHILCTQHSSRKQIDSLLSLAEGCIMTSSKLDVVWYPYRLTTDGERNVVFTANNTLGLARTDLIEHRGWWEESLTARLTAKPTLEGRLMVRHGTEYPNAASLFPFQ